MSCALFERDAKAVANGFLGHRLMRAERHHHVEGRRPPRELLVQGLKQRSTGAVRVASGTISRTFLLE